MSVSNKNNDFGESPTWKHMQKALTLGGLGFWRIKLQPDGSLIYTPDQTLLTLLNVKRSDFPIDIKDTINKFFHPEDIPTLMQTVQDCFMGKISSFDLEHRLLLPNSSGEMRVHIFGDIEERAENGQVLVVSGCSQNIQEQYDARVALENALEINKITAERSRIMLDSMPLICDMWDSNSHSLEYNNATISLPMPKSLQGKIADDDGQLKLTLVDVNKEALKTLGMPDKQSYFDNFHRLSTEFQADGRPSSEIMPKLMDTVFREGRATFEWMHQKLDGTLMPSEVTLVKVPHNNGVTVVSYTRDLTEIQAAKAELDTALEINRIATERTLMMLDSMPTVCDFWDTNPQNIDPSKAVGPLSVLGNKYAYLMDVNKATLTLFDMPDKQSYLDFFHKLSPEFQPNGSLSSELIIEKVNTALLEGEISFEWMHQKIDGTPIPCEVTLVRVPYGNGLTIISYKRDLRVLKAAQEQLDVALEKNIEDAKRTRIMLDAMPLVCDFWDTNPHDINLSEAIGPLSALQGKYAFPIDVNNEAVALFELPCKDTYLHCFHNLSPEFQPDGSHSNTTICEKMNEVLDKGIISFEWMHQKLDGTQIPCEITLIRVEYGNSLIIVSYKRDLRTLKAAQKQLNLALEKNIEDAKRTRIMLDAMPLVCDFWDIGPYSINHKEAVGPLPAIQGKYTFPIDVNKAALELFDLPDKETYLHSFGKLSPLFQPDGTTAEAVMLRRMNEVITKGVMTFEWMHQKLDGTPIPCEITLIRVEYGNNLIIVSYKRDLRALKSAHAELDIALEENKVAAERTSIMLDAMPIVCDFWDINPHNIDIKKAIGPLTNAESKHAYLMDVNKAALQLFNLPNKQEYLNSFHKLSPEFQPDGINSKEVILEKMNEVLLDGVSNFEWMHQCIDGRPIPCEITLIRVPYGDSVTIVSYKRDLRALKASQAKLDYALKQNRITAKRISTMINTLPIVCNFWDTDSCHMGKAKTRLHLTKNQDKCAYLTDANQAAMTMFDLPDVQTYIDNFIKLSPEFQPDGRESKSTLLELMSSAFDDGKPKIFEWMHQKLDGTPVPCEITLIRASYGNDCTLVGYMRDLRDLKATQAELDKALEANRAADERTHIMLDTLPIVCNFWDTNPHNIINSSTKFPITGNSKSKYISLIDANQEAMTMFELPDRQTFIDSYRKLSPKFQPNGRLSMELAHELLNEMLCDGKSKTFEWMHQKLDGTPIPCEITLIRVPYGESTTVLSYTHDLRKLKDAQSAMVVERLLLKKIMDSSPICFTISVNDTIKFITPFAQQFTNCNIGDKVSKMHVSELAYTELKSSQGKNIYHPWHNVRIKGPKGTIHSMLLNSFETDYYGEIGVMSWFTDVTEMRQKNRELHQAKIAAEESTKAKSNFLANMSHEIRTPMNAILGLLHLLMQGQLDPTQLEYIIKTEGAAKALLRIINDILDFSKIEAGKLEMENEVFKLDELLQNVIDLATDNIRTKGLECIVNVQPNMPEELIGDQVRFTQILSNLLNNAIKFTAQGQILLKIEIISEFDHTITLRCMIQDSGIGLTEKQIKTLFSAFTQADASTTRRYGGTGLGLAICKRLVEMMGGNIWVESEYGSGSSFIFTANFGVPKNLDHRHTLVTDINFHGISVLIVDDSQIALDCLKIFLENLGLKVEMALSGHEALHILTDANYSGESFDLIFIDWKMPDMDGIETSVRINQLSFKTIIPVIIMVTAYDRGEVIGLIKRAGIRSVVTKPLLPSGIINILNDVFGRNLPSIADNISKNNNKDQDMVKDFKGACILLAEDNEINQLVAFNILQNAGLEIDIANNGLEAVEMTKTGKYELILMDIQMPEMDGIEATREIRSIPEFKKIPILAMTANAMSGDREVSLNAGMNDYISKPIDLHEMFFILSKWLRKNRERNK